MTHIEFHFNVADKLHHCCRLLRKACGQGEPMGVIGLPADLDRLDQLLWTFSAHDFIPHVRCRAPDTPKALHTPVLLADSAQWLRDDMTLVHIGMDVPAGFERFKRVLEMVSVDPEDRFAARARWKHYKQQGHALLSHDFNPSTPQP